MDSATEDIYLQKIEQFVYDEDKIVTYSWLSAHLDINVNDAKQLLEKYVKDVRVSKLNDLAITYILLGTKHDNGLGIILSKENCLTENKTHFKTVTSQQIYSIQKCKDVDLNILSLVEPFDKHNLREKPLLGSIVGKNCIKRKLKNIPQEKSTQNDVTETKVVNNKAKNGKNMIKSDSQSKFNKSGQNSIGNFFSKAPIKSEIKNDVKATKPKQNNFMTKFFSQAPVKTNENNGTIENNEEATENNEETIEDMENTLQVDIKVDDNVEKHISKKMKKINATVGTAKISSDLENDGKNRKQENTKPKKKGKRQRKDNKSDQPAKKRKRILERNDSDSDDIFGSDDEKAIEDVVELSDKEPEPVYEAPPVFVPKNKKRVQKISQYVDDDNYIMTKKEWVLVSASEDEDDKEQKPQNVKPTKKEKSKLEVSPPKAIKNKGKASKGPQNQQTLMSFFKKM